MNTQEEKECILEDEDVLAKASLALDEKEHKIMPSHRAIKLSASANCWSAISCASALPEGDGAKSSGPGWALLPFRDLFLHQPNLPSLPDTSCEARQNTFSPERAQCIEELASSHSVFLVIGKQGYIKGTYYQPCLTS